MEFKEPKIDEIRDVVKAVFGIMHWENDGKIHLSWISGEGGVDRGRIEIVGRKVVLVVKDRLNEMSDLERRLSCEGYDVVFRDESQKS